MNKLNDIRAVSVRLVIPWRGAWFAEVDLDLDDPATAPTGPATLRIGEATLTGTIDPRASGRMGARAGVRVVGGGGAWDLAVAPRHFHNDGGVKVSAIVSSTAAEVGERSGKLPEDVLGADYVRVAGAASQVFGARQWYVGFDGVTHVAERPEVPAPADLDVLSYKPETATAEIASDEIVLPGWTITDERFGAVVARDVEQTFGADGARATVWCAEAPRSRLASALASVVRGMAGVSHSRVFEYRVYGMAGNRVELQVVRPSSGAPDLIPASIWMGIPGTRAELAPGSRVLVEFVEGDPARPVVRAFEGSDPPLSTHIDARKVVIGAGSQPVALASSVVDAISALQTEIAAVAAALVAVAKIAPLTDAHTGAAAKATDAVTAAKLLVDKASQQAPSIKLSSE